MSEKLNIALPPLRGQIQQLEAERSVANARGVFGGQLLHRDCCSHSDGAGALFFKQALQALQRTDAMRAMIRRVSARARGGSWAVPESVLGVVAAIALVHINALAR
jgi:hypothetical protein